MQAVIDGVRIGYDVTGSGPPLVLLHGFPFGRTIWDELTPSLAACARVIRIDLRGSGESQSGDGPALMETLAGDVYGLLDALDVERVVLAGHSMGGYAALAFFRMYAERVAGLGLVASQVAADSPERARERAVQAARVAEQGIGAIAEAVLAGAFAPDFAAAAPHVVAQAAALIRRQSPAGAAAQILGMAERLDSAELLEDIRVPALLVIGERDTLLDSAAAEQTAAAIADCELVRLPNAAHMPMLEAPQATAAALERLIARSVAADPRIARADRA